MHIAKSSTMPSSMLDECSEGSLPHGRFTANSLADRMKVSPLYRQRDAQRWNQAISCYQEMRTNRDQCCTSPPNSPVDEGVFRKLSLSGMSSADASPPRGFECSRDCRFPGNSLSGSLMSSLPSLTKVSTHNRSLHGTNPQSRGDSSLELEAIAAVHELSFAVQSISVSEMLPRTSELIFVNVTTMEGQPYCIELTLKGWRITSLRNDCMQGDFKKIELFTKYYASLYELMDVISPGYKRRFSERLAHRLKLLQEGMESDLVAPPSSYACTPLFESPEPSPILHPFSSHAPFSSDSACVNSNIE